MIESAARRKDLDEGEYKSISRPTSERHKREPVQLANRSQSAKTLVAGRSNSNVSILELYFISPFYTTILQKRVHIIVINNALICLNHKI